MVKKMETEHGKICKEINMLDNGLMVKYKGMVFIKPPKARNMKDILLIFSSMAKLKRYFQMGIYLKEIIFKENQKVLAFINSRNIKWFMRVIFIKV